ncbi:hypothetical protein SMI01S_11630 [Sphingobacterium mizutaii NBRC 14946 = DSM 11724]|uniref:Uncharacterized protein n=2 Tax=Sphingobacterium mizutaii TaxID=1010 RepID=A0AAJ4XCT5_9SPHI|nr:hypothetical protein [Sphingobacterium mizutaii]GEM67557.1 hypothetical protein SMI01S_11630 [Sphingobacterium mizutaii NBRC 14946 = DSM 11724]SDL14180.1 Chromosome segregation ATPase [Sphingobacterium mizutaii]SNV52086.1 Uncharacterised protein [Sphingobacterium mizutaii]
MASGEEYKVPFSVDVTPVVSEFNRITDSAKEVQKESAKTKDAISEMNKEIVSGAEKTNKALSEQAQNTVALKKVAEERAKAERVMVQVFDEVSKKQSEGIKLNDQAAKAVKAYSENLSYFKDALKTATDPTQIQILSKSMERLRDNIISAYDRSAKAITPMNKKLEEAGNLTDKLSDSIMGSFSTEELDKLSNDLNNASGEMEQLGALIDFIASKMETMDKDSDLFKSLTTDIEEANKMLGRTSEEFDIASLSSDQLIDRLKYLKDALQVETNPQEIVSLNKEIENTEGQLKRIKNAGKDGFDELGNKLIPAAEEKVKTLGSELEGVIQQLARMKSEGLGDTQDYDDLMNKATQLKQSIKGVNDELKRTASETPTLDSLIESGTLIASAFNIAQGAAALFGSENENLEKTIARLTAGISILQGLQQIQIELKNKESVANKVLTASQALYTTVVGTSTGALKVFRIALASTGVGLIILAIGALIANWDKLTESVKMSGPEAEKWGQKIDKLKAILFGVGNAVLQYLIGPIKMLYTLFTDGAEAAVNSYIDSMNVIKNYNAGFISEIQNQNDAAHKKKLEAQKISLEQEIELKKAAGKKTVELERALHSTNLALTKAGSDEQKEVMHEFQVWQAKANKDAADERKKAAEKTAKDSEEAARKKEEEYNRIRDFNNKLKDLEFERSESSIRQMKDGAEKEAEQEELRYKKELENLKRDLEGFKGSEEEKAKLILSQNALKEELKEEHISKLWAIDVEYFDKMVEAQKEADKTILKLNGENQKLELEELDEKYSNLSKKYKEAYGSERDFTEEKMKEIAEIKLKYGLQELKDREDIETARISLVKINGKTEEEEEKIREAMKYQVMLDAAEERLDLLKSVGGKENKVAIAQTEALIAELNLKIGKSTTKKKTNVFQLLGLDIEDVEARQIVETFKNVFDQITEAWIDSINQRIDAKQKEIDSLNNQISDVESALNKELELQENGYANNVEAKRQELEQLKIQRENEILEKEALLKRQAEIQKVQLIADSVAQTSSMITASANIFKAFSSIPFVGVPLAIAAIGAMWGGFIASKAMAMKSISDAPKFRHGGKFVLDGPSHEQGGLGVYNEKTGKRVAEVEGNEGFFAINRESTKKYMPFLEAINNDDLSKVGNLMDDLIQDTGVVLPDHDKTAKVIVLSKINKDREETYKDALLTFLESEDLKDIARTNRSLFEIERKRKIITETNDFIIIQQGNTTHKIRKNKNAV